MWTVYELACFLSPLVVIMPRQVLTVVHRFLTVEVPQIQF